MHQKYRISQNSKKDKLKIREYAIIDNIPKNVRPSMFNHDSYELVCEENYKSEELQEAIEKGSQALIAALRTSNFYPITPYAEKIAETTILRVGVAPIFGSLFL